MIERLTQALQAEGDLAYAIVFGSTARGTARGGSDLDVAVSYAGRRRPATPEIGSLVARLEAATSARIDLTLIDEAPPALAYRVFRDGRTLLLRDRGALVARKAEAILEYLDFRPIEQLTASGVLAAARRDR